MKTRSHFGVVAHFLFVFFVVSLAHGSALGDSDWPQFRGPNGNGTAVRLAAPTKIEQSNVQWEVPIHGKGWSSPVVADGRVWLTTATQDGKEMSVVCVDASSGSILHDKVLVKNDEPEFCHPMNSYATPTPVIVGGNVYVHFGAYLTACLDTKSADVIWERRDLKCDHHRGPASSPIVHGDQLFVAYDGFDVQYVAALHTQTGKTLWRADRTIQYGTDNGDRKKAYCTGHVINVGGQDQLIYPSAVATIAYEPKSGKEIWTAYHGGMNASARPLYHDGLLFITNGMGGMVAVNPDGKGDISQSNIVWAQGKAVAKKSSQLIVENLLYMVSDDGIATCRDPKTGDIHWQKRLESSYAASPIFVDGKVYFFSTEGHVTTIKPGKEFEKLASTKLGDGFMASAAVTEHGMILRSKSKLYLVK